MIMNNKIILAKVMRILSKHKYKIYVDLDNVLADFDHGFEGRKPKSTKKMWKEVGEMGKDFWTDLKLMPGAKELWNYLEKYNPIILSAHPNPRNGEKMVKEAIKGKREWLAKHFDESVAKKAIIKTRAEKINHASANSILIDDLLINIIEFNKAGGKGIHHSSTKKTIAKLKKLGL